MHTLYWFLFTPEPGGELLKEAEYAYSEYADRNCDDNNWGETVGVITGNGQRLICPGKEDVLKAVFGKIVPSAAEMQRVALCTVAAVFGVSATTEGAIAGQVSRKLAKMYAAIPGYDYERSLLASGYELFCECAVAPFSRRVATPYEYRFFDLREERWEDGCDLIRPHDAVLFMDIHT